MHLSDQIVKTGKNIPFQAYIVGYPASSMNCFYKECPLVVGLKWPVYEKCNTLQIVPVQLDTQTKDFVQHAKIDLKPKLPGILSCDVNNSNSNSTEQKGNVKVNVVIQDFEKDLNILNPSTEVIEGFSTEFVCQASNYNLTEPIIFKRIDEIVKTYVGKLMMIKEK